MHCMRPWAHEHIFKCAKFPITHAHIGPNSLLAYTKRIFFSSSTGRNATANPLLISMILANWVEQLPRVLLGLPNTPKEDIRASTAELVFGTPMTLPGMFAAGEETLAGWTSMSNTTQHCRSSPWGSATSSPPCQVHLLCAQGFE